jgi:glycosyltransferase involved in cell wall biosynthesis
MQPRRVVVLRGTAANPWDLRAWEDLGPDWDVRVVVPPNNDFDTSGVGIRRVGVRTAGGRLGDAGLPGRLALKAIGERYIGLDAALAGADIVHAAELGTWYAAQAAARRARHGYRLALTVWETLPFGDTYRNVRTRPYRRRVLGATDLFLPVTERARTALLLEGAPAGRIRVCPPGIDIDRFAAARTARPPAGGGHLVLSIGRLVWEKGHQDLLRAIALLATRGRRDVRVLIVGTGPEEARLRGVARDLGIADRVELRGWVPHSELTDVYAAASCFVLGSMPVWSWEEQFGMVLAEAMAAHVPVVAAASGAIPEVLGGSGTLFNPGDWVGLADALEQGPLAGEPGARRVPDPALLESYSTTAAAARLRAAYGELTAA